MPQLSFETYFTQYLWFLILLGILYYIVTTKVAPTISLIKKARSVSVSGSDMKASTQAQSAKIYTPSGPLFHCVTAIPQKDAGADTLAAFIAADKKWADNEK